MAKTAAQRASARAKALKAKEYHSSTKPDFTELKIGAENYQSVLGQCLNWMSQEFRTPHLKGFAIEWAEDKGYDIDALENATEYSFMGVGNYAFILLQGGELDDRLSTKFIAGMKKAEEEGKGKKKVVEAKEKITKVVRNIPLEYAEDVQDLVILEQADDETVSDLLMNSPMNMVEMGAFAKRVEEFVADWFDNDPQCVEMREIAGEERVAYMRQTYTNVIKIAGMMVENLKAAKKSSKKKGYAEMRAEKKVKNVRTKKIDTNYNLISLPAEEILGAKIMVVFNTKNRRVGYYVASDDQGLSVKGATIQGFDESKSFSRITRNPDRDLPHIRNAKNERRVEVMLVETIKGVQHKVNGRLNSDTVILKVFK